MVETLSGRQPTSEAIVEEKEDAKERDPENANSKLHSGEQLIKEKNNSEVMFELDCGRKRIFEGF